MTSCTPLSPYPPMFLAGAGNRQLAGLVAVAGLIFTAFAASAQDEGVAIVPACNTDFQPAGMDFPLLAPSEDYAIPEDAVIREIHYTRLPIFNLDDPDENNRLFRWANRFHIMTREETIAQQVLFEEGERYDDRLLQETSRILRRQGYFFDTESRPVSLCGDQVDIEVITRDTWSLMPGLTFDRTGGNNTYGISLEDSNILGLGNQFAIDYSKDVDRSTYETHYKDNNLFGTRYAGEIILRDSDDGYNRLVAGGLPFFELDSRRMWQVRFEQEERDDPLFVKGDKVYEVGHDITDYSITLGFSGGLQEGLVKRWRLGYRYRDDSFGPGDELGPPPEFPQDQRLSYPFVAYERIEDNFITELNLDQIYRTEDLHLGSRLYSVFGYAPEALGSDVDRLVWYGEFNDTLVYDGDQLMQHSLEWESKWNFMADRVEDLLVEYDLRYFRRQTEDRSFFVDFRAVYSKNLNTNRQVTMGGLNGVRAFDNRLQTGTRSINLVLEERVYTDLHIFNLVRVGAAIFLDIGRAWEPGAEELLPDDWLVSTGFGLRLGSSKAASSRIAHIDFAFPLTNKDDPAVDSFQIAFNVKGAF